MANRAWRRRVANTVPLDIRPVHATQLRTLPLVGPQARWHTRTLLDRQRFFMCGRAGAGFDCGVVGNLKPDDSRDLSASHAGALSSLMQLLVRRRG